MWWNKNKKYKVNIPIIRKNFKKTRSAKFKGFLKIISNKYGIIYDWKIEFDYIDIDLYTTPSWFIHNKNLFKIRNALFKKLKLEQFKRPARNTNKIIKLNFEQINIVNNFLNDRKKYNSTVKNIVGVLKGNNPGGEAKNPNSAEIIINLKNYWKNFIILIDDLIMKNKIDYDLAIMNSTPIDIDVFFKLNQTIKAAFWYMQKNKKWNDWIYYLENIKAYYKQYNIDIFKATRLVNKARSKFSLNIDKYIKKFPFNFNNANQFTKCHIYEVHKIKDKIINAIRKEKKPTYYVNMIEDYNNFIPLSQELHRQFDKNFFTYDKQGQIKYLNLEGKKYIEENIESIFWKIPSFFWNKKRKSYFYKKNFK